MKIYFYYLKNPETKQIRYIGQSKNPKHRFYQHIHEARVGRKNTKKNSWIKSILSMDMMPEMEIFETFFGSPDAAHKREWELILDHLNRGFDLVNGNDGGSPHYLLDENLRPVYQYDRTSLVLLREFRCAFDAYADTGIRDGNIARACSSIERHRVRFTGNYLWSYEKHDVFPKDRLVFSVRHNQKKVSAKNVKTGEILMFDSARAAAKKLGCSWKNISLCCTGFRKSHHGYEFSFV